MGARGAEWRKWREVAFGGKVERYGGKEKDPVRYDMAGYGANVKDIRSMMLYSSAVDPWLPFSFSGNYHISFSFHYNSNTNSTEYRTTSYPSRS